MDFELLPKRQVLMLLLRLFKGWDMGGQGGRITNNVLETHFPRLTGLVREGLEVSVNIEACVNMPRRPAGVALAHTRLRRSTGPNDFGMIRTGRPGCPRRASLDPFPCR